jgi:hypothetical protein
MKPIEDVAVFDKVTERKQLLLSLFFSILELFTHQKKKKKKKTRKIKRLNKTQIFFLV